jgi:hypothetical protein
VSAAEEERAHTLSFLRRRVNAIRRRNPVLDEIRGVLDESAARYEVRSLLADALERGPGTRVGRELAAPLRRLAAVQQARLARWRKVRPGLEPVRVRGDLQRYRRKLAGFVANLAAADYLLRVRFFLPDIYSLPYTDLAVADAAGRWRPVAERAMVKPPLDDVPYHEVVFPFRMPGAPTAVRIAGYGYGGQGVAFVRVVGRRGREWRPTAIRATGGRVADATHLLTDDLRWCFLGEHDTRRGFMWNDYKRIAHSVEVGLAAVPASGRKA